MFFAAISAPILWKKVQFQNGLTWCGWRINFLHETIELTPEKTLKLKGQLRELLKAGRVKRKLLEQVLGLLIWATSLSPELRSGTFGNRLAFAAGLHICAFVAILPFSIGHQSRAQVSSARHLHATRL